ncbi:hypothetical protein CLV24_10951 [Pontibacter ummariensis]|uniref:Heavy-metal resistance n=1 Tax=Pontibacter ummariensis TaxID=1610492 RepID=A0A239FU11_9BACT|nr:hypothetical protein [Pontibacter ummariensis]PRY11926.1 hypothetical protein CLV24_10951 [Pontibacter ummariensis]SNS60275.1 hypothetical protein SAMN06296052_109119 [Pontibacter ummariensis]
MLKFLLLSLGTLFCTAGHAQHLKVADDGLDRQVLAVSLDGPAMATLEMSRELNLTEQQYAEVERINQQRYQKLAEAENTYATDPILQSRAYRMLAFESSELLKHILSERQMQHLNQLKGNANAQLTEEVKGE